MLYLTLHLAGGPSSIVYVDGAASLQAIFLLSDTLRVLPAHLAFIQAVRAS